MASLSKGISLSRVNVKSILVSIGVLALVVALFFIPEIIDFQKSLGSGKIQRVESAPVEQPKEAKGIEALNQVSNMLSSGYIEQLKAKKVASSAKEAGTADKPGVTATSTLTWDDVKSKESSNALRAAQRDVLTVARKLPPSKVSTRYALYNFSSAIDMLLDGADKTMSAEEGLRYLGFAHGAVLGAMDRDAVDRGDYNRMAELSLGPAAAKLLAIGTARNIKPFDPRLTLNGVRVKQQSDNYGRWNPRGRVFVYLRGFVVGKDIKRIDVYRDGQRYARIIPRVPNSLGRRNFRTRQWKGLGLFRFQVVDKSGQIYEKQYRFFPRVAKFPWRDGSFQIPSRGEHDIRLDRYFTARRGGVVGPGGSASTSYGPGYKKF